jgi:hypothetical protein
MDSSIYVASPTVRLPEQQQPTPANSPPNEAILVLRQVLEVQREQLNILKAQQANADTQARWRSFLQRWSHEFPGVGQSCKDVLPIIERAYLSMIQEMTEKVQEEESELSSEFTLGEFLDRYGVRLSQLGAILGQLGPLADAAPADAERPK